MAVHATKNCKKLHLIRIGVTDGLKRGVALESSSTPASGRLLAGALSPAQAFHSQREAEQAATAVTDGELCPALDPCAALMLLAQTFCKL